MLNKSLRVDEELIKLAKEYIAVLQKDGGKYSQANAIKVALRKVLLK